MALTGRLKRVRERLGMRRDASAWAADAAAAERLDLATLKVRSLRARRTREAIDDFLRVAEERLLAPPGAGIDAPLQSDWAWRPEPWRRPATPAGMAAVGSPARLAADTTLFHDCRQSELCLRQVRNGRPGDRNAFGLRIDVFRFDGSYLSLVVDLPEAALNGLSRGHVLRAQAAVELERPIEIFGRLNVRHGPNTEQMVREFDLSRDAPAAEFDLGYSGLNEKRIEKAWVDLIFEGPSFNQILLRDLTFSRHPRAAL
ncbi:MAG: DUF6478 family protein [Rhodobacteraceae bacterium]|nr:DUF6478 family protein [Paracoccaceae bacterium]